MSSQASIKILRRYFNIYKKLVKENNHLHDIYAIIHSFSSLRVIL